MNTETKKKIGIVALGLLLITVIGATYAYFVAQKGSGGSANIDVESGTTDLLSFKVGDAITIEANSDNFAKDKGNREGQTTATATLVANNGNYTATDNYYLYLNIIDNPFQYTESNQAELILQVTDPNGDELETLDGGNLNYVTLEGMGEDENAIQGFDITEASGLIAIKNLYEISAVASADDNNGKASQTWNIKVILINRDYDQQVNTGKTFNAEVLIQHEEKTETITLANYIKKQYSAEGVNGLYFHDASLDGGAGDNSYRYAGLNPDNYVCFNTKENCQQNGEYLYRIVGVFNNDGVEKVKLVKNVSWINDNWDENGKSNWRLSSLFNKLNGTDVDEYQNYLTFLGEEWADKISLSTWYVGGINNYRVSPKVIYEDELGSTRTKVQDVKCASQEEAGQVACTQDDLEVKAKVGLLYASDFGFASLPEQWTKSLYDYDATDNYLVKTNTNYRTWLITSYVNSNIVNNVLYIVNYPSEIKGYVQSGKVSGSYNFVMPAFYLNPEVSYVSGSGSSNDPYIIS